MTDIENAPREMGKRESELIAARRENLAALRSRGNDPFAARRYDVDTNARELTEKYSFLVSGQAAQGDAWSLAGRVMGKRGTGRTLFVDLHDRSGRLQLYIRKDEVGDATFADWQDLDRGDVVGVRGYMFRSKLGELTLRVTSFSILGKALVPLPDKWHGLTDVEKRYRQRHVDLLVNPEVRNAFILRSRLIAAMRSFIDGYGFCEVETPVLLHLAGGAAARPFRTFSNALDLPLDLRIATELYLKRLIVGGLERVYEIGRIFRNEGIDTTHNPEFTMLELYAAYWSVDEMREFNEALIAHLVSVVLPGRDELPFGDRLISFSRPFERISYLDAMQRFGNVSRDELLNPAGAQRVALGLGLPASPSHAHALDKIFERIVEPQLTAPTFVCDYPVLLSPLAKRKPDDPEIADRYELFVANMEISNAFTELNDPDDQRRRFQAQVAQRAGGDEEIPAPDWDYVHALEYGMPPTAGIGIGVDRLMMILTNNQSVRDVILFPLQRPL